MPDQIKPKKKRLKRKPNFDTAPFEMDQAEIEGPDIRFKNDPWHKEGPSNVFAARRARLAKAIVAPSSRGEASLNRVG